LQTQQDTVSRGIDSSKTGILKSGFDLVPYFGLAGGVRNEARRKLGANEDDLLLINVSRLYPEKAQSALLKAFRRILDTHPDSWLWILGVGPLEDQLKQEAETLGLGNRVLFQGFVDNVAVWLALADIQVHPSHAEGVPLAVLSGMAASIPVVASAVGGVNEVIRDGETGLLVPSADAPDFEEKFVASIERLLSSPETRRDMGNAARQFIEEDYSLLSAVREIDTVYRELLD
jgi:glycosyltransferase involved in cell wall biosynthesis